MLMFSWHGLVMKFFNDNLWFDLLINYVYADDLGLIDQWNSVTAICGLINYLTFLVRCFLGLCNQWNTLTAIHGFIYKLTLFMLMLSWTRRWVKYCNGNMWLDLLLNFNYADVFFDYVIIKCCNGDTWLDLLTSYVWWFVLLD